LERRPPSTNCAPSRTDGLKINGILIEAATAEVTDVLGVLLLLKTLVVEK
jgi:hypothetical protein